MCACKSKFPSSQLYKGSDSSSVIARQRAEQSLSSSGPAAAGTLCFHTVGERLKEEKRGNGGGRPEPELFFLHMPL